MIGNENLVSILNPGLANRQTSRQSLQRTEQNFLLRSKLSKTLTKLQRRFDKTILIERIERLPFINTNAVLKSEILNTEQNKSVSIFETSAGHGHRGERLSSCSVSRRVAARRDVSSQLNLNSASFVICVYFV